MWIVESANTRFFVFFFFSSRRRHTRLQGDWSSDVCSSDLDQPRATLSLDEAVSCPKTVVVNDHATGYYRVAYSPELLSADLAGGGKSLRPRSEERRVGKECRSRWSPYH